MSGHTEPVIAEWVPNGRISDQHLTDVLLIDPANIVSAEPLAELFTRLPGLAMAVTCNNHWVIAVTRDRESLIQRLPSDLNPPATAVAIRGIAAQLHARYAMRPLRKKGC